MRIWTIAISSILIALATGTTAPAAQDPTICSGCTSGGGGSSSDTDSDPLNLYSVQINLVTSISPGICLTGPEPLLECHVDAGCPFTLQAFYQSNVSVDIGLSPDSLVPATWTPKPPASGWTMSARRSDNLDCGGTMQPSAQITNEALGLSAGTVGYLTCSSCGKTQL